MTPSRLPCASPQTRSLARGPHNHLITMRFPHVQRSSRGKSRTVQPVPPRSPVRMDFAFSRIPPVPAFAPLGERRASPVRRTASVRPGSSVLRVSAPPLVGAGLLEPVTAMPTAPRLPFASRRVKAARASPRQKMAACVPLQTVVRPAFGVPDRAAPREFANR